MRLFMNIKETAAEFALSDQGWANYIDGRGDLWQPQPIRGRNRKLYSQKQIELMARVYACEISEEDGEQLWQDMKKARRA